MYETTWKAQIRARNRTLQWVYVQAIHQQIAKELIETQYGKIIAFGPVQVRAAKGGAGRVARPVRRFGDGTAKAPLRLGGLFKFLGKAILWAGAGFIAIGFLASRDETRKEQSQAVDGVQSDSNSKPVLDSVMPAGDFEEPIVDFANEESAIPLNAETSAAQGLITDPVWKRTPTDYEIERLYPERAAKSEKAGEVVLDCTVIVYGRLDCLVDSEEPEGWGFGEAAKELAKTYQMAPQTPYGESTLGKKLHLPISFRISR